MIKLATVSPCFNEEEVLRHSVERLTALFERMIAEKLFIAEVDTFAEMAARALVHKNIFKIKNHVPTSIVAPNIIYSPHVFVKKFFVRPYSRKSAVHRHRRLC